MTTPPDKPERLTCSKCDYDTSSETAFAYHECKPERCEHGVLGADDCFQYKPAESAKGGTREQFIEAAIECALAQHRELYAAYEKLKRERDAEKKRADKAEEDVRFYRREWESACERVNYAQEEGDEARAEVERLKVELKDASEGHHFSLEVETDMAVKLRDTEAQLQAAREENERVRKHMLDWMARPSLSKRPVIKSEIKEALAARDAEGET